MVTLLLVSVLGGIGAMMRFLLDGVVTRFTSPRFPLGTLLINLAGSLLLGLVTGLTAHRVLPERWLVAVGVGLLGGFTTFSTASFETVRLMQQRRPAAALVQALGMLLGTTALAGLGLWTGSRL